MWQKNTNLKPGFKCGLNPGFGFAKMNGFPQAPGFLKPGLNPYRSPIFCPFRSVFHSAQNNVPGTHISQ